MITTTMATANKFDDKEKEKMGEQITEKQRIETRLKFSEMQCTTGIMS